MTTAETTLWNVQAKRGKLSMALHLLGQELSLWEIAARWVISKGAKKGEHPSPATVMRMLREHDQAAVVPAPREDVATVENDLTQHGVLPCDRST
ncbi:MULTISPECIES: hypothetical protein [unclassified Streptomyces]|uniref:hypothetical protein n=1 Tax=unclassified Streptomyces TaxID=2593676 RepID=UPI001F3B130C|nr:hypothetical protein [Streptomyces sp. CB01373]